MTDRIIYDHPTIVLPHSQEHWDLSQKINILQDENNWLEDAVSFNVYNANSKRLRGLVNRIFEEVQGVIPTPNRQRYCEVVKRVLINLWHGHYIKQSILLVIMTIPPNPHNAILPYFQSNRTYNIVESRKYYMFSFSSTIFAIYTVYLR